MRIAQHLARQIAQCDAKRLAGAAATLTEVRRCTAEFLASLAAHTAERASCSTPAVAPVDALATPLPITDGGAPMP
jgi:hypothetical protein